MQKHLSETRGNSHDEAVVGWEDYSGFGAGLIQAAAGSESCNNTEDYWAQAEWESRSLGRVDGYSGTEASTSVMQGRQCSGWFCPNKLLGKGP